MRETLAILDTKEFELSNDEFKSRVGKAFTISLIGLIGYVVEVEALNASGLPAFRIVGLPDTSLSESTSRVLSAYKSSNLRWTRGAMTVNLAPAYIPKKGTSFDLAIFVATLRALKLLKQEPSEDTLFIGELGLDGKIHPVRGILPMVCCAMQNGFKHIVVARDNETEAKMVKDLDVLGFAHITELIHHYGGTAEVKNIPLKPAANAHNLDTRKIGDFSEVLGQATAKFCLEIAAAGGHHAIMVGPPGIGKSMLASRLPSIMPKLSAADSLEVSSIHSIAGTLQSGLIEIPPFESPHHTASTPSIIGGGTGLPKPGAVSRAHKGILFMDEAPEFSPRVLQTLRQPLETGEVIIDRAEGSAKYPSSFQLVMAANPCPCGNNIGAGIDCVCSQMIRRRYFQRLSGPLLDRIDLHIEVEKVKMSKEIDKQIEPSSEVLRRVIDAQNAAAARLSKTPWRKNSQVPGSYLRKVLGHESIAVKTVNSAVDKGYLSLRGADRCLRLAWTIADLDKIESPTTSQIENALALRTGERLNGSF